MRKTNFFNFRYETIRKDGSRAYLLFVLKIIRILRKKLRSLTYLKIVFSKSFLSLLIQNLYSDRI